MPYIDTGTMPELAGFKEVTNEYDQLQWSSHRFDRLFLIAKETLQKNSEVADILEQSGRQKAAETVYRCGRLLGGHDIEDAKALEYCKQYRFCTTCSNRLAMKRAELMRDAVVRFSDDIDTKNLKIHKFVIKPDLDAIVGNRTVEMEFAYKLLAQFKREFQKMHNDRAVGRYLTNRIGGGNRQARKVQVWGPAATTMHFMPSSSGYLNSYDTYLHLHVSLITSRRTLNSVIEQLIQEAWDLAKKNTNASYKVYKQEVKRATLQNQKAPKGGLGVFNTEPVLITSNGERLYEDSFELVRQNFSYMSQVIKPKWPAEAIIEAAELQTDLGIKTVGGLFQRLGGMNSSNKLIDCHKFPIADKRTLAWYAGVDWRIFRNTNALS